MEELYSVTNSRQTDQKEKRVYSNTNTLKDTWYGCCCLWMKRRKLHGGNEQRPYAFTIFFHFLSSPSFSSRWSWDSLTFPLLRQVVSFPRIFLFLSKMVRTRGLLWSTNIMKRHVPYYLKFVLWIVCSKRQELSLVCYITIIYQTTFMEMRCTFLFA